MANFEKASVGEKIAGYVDSRKKILIALVVVVVVAIAAFALFTGITSSAAKKGLSAIDKISYTLTENSSDLSDEALAERKETALASLQVYNKKGGVVGVRANMLSAEIAYSKKDYEKAADYYAAAAAKGKKAYTAPIVYFNAAAAYENAGNNEKACEFYEKASNDKDFLLASRAAFELGRVKEAAGDTEGAIAAFKKVYDKEPDSSWGKLSKTELLKLENK